MVFFRGVTLLFRWSFQFNWKICASQIGSSSQGSGVKRTKRHHRPFLWLTKCHADGFTGFLSWCFTSLENRPENPMAHPLQLKTTPILMLFISHFLTSSSKRHRPCLPCRLISLHPSSDPRMANSSTIRSMGFVLFCGGKNTCWVFFSINLKVNMSKILLELMHLYCVGNTM